MAQITDMNGEMFQISDNEINRGILLDRINFLASGEDDLDEKELLTDLASWLSKVSFA